MLGDIYGDISAKRNAVRVRIFYSYAAKDQVYQEALEKHLAILRQTGSIEEWHNGKFQLGRIGIAA